MTATTSTNVTILDINHILVDKMNLPVIDYNYIFFH